MEEEEWVMCVRVDVRGRCPTKNLEVLVISCPRTWTVTFKRQHQYRSFGRLKGWSMQSWSYNDRAPPGPLTCTWRHAHDSISQLQAIKNWRRERPGNGLGTAWGQPGNKVTKSWNLFEIVPRIDPWNVLGIDPWNVLGNVSIRSCDRALIQTSQHGRENEEQSSLHNQLIFVTFGVLYATHSFTSTYKK